MILYIATKGVSLIYYLIVRLFSYFSVLQLILAVTVQHGIKLNPGLRVEL